MAETTSRRGFLKQRRARGCGRRSGNEPGGKYLVGRLRTRGPVPDPERPGRALTPKIMPRGKIGKVSRQPLVPRRQLDRRLGTQPRPALRLGSSSRPTTPTPKWPRRSPPGRTVRHQHGPDRPGLPERRGEGLSAPHAGEDADTSSVSIPDKDQTRMPQTRSSSSSTRGRPCSTTHGEVDRSSYDEQPTSTCSTRRSS